MREFDVCGLGNAIVDIFVEVSDAEFAGLGFERGTMRLVEPADQKQLLELTALVDAGELRAELDSVFPLTEARTAFERVAGRGKRGKVVLEVGTD